jgi:hypothetical protein
MRRAISDRHAGTFADSGHKGFNRKRPCRRRRS